MWRNEKRKGKAAKEEGAVRDRDVEEGKEKVVMGEVVRVFSANLLFHLCSPPALQPRPAKRHFTSHPHTRASRASEPARAHTPQNSTRSHTTGI